MRLEPRQADIADIIWTNSSFLRKRIMKWSESKLNFKLSHVSKYWMWLSPFCIDWQRTMFVYWQLVVKISFSSTVYFWFHHSNLIHWSKNLDRPWQMHRPSYRSVVRLHKISESELFWKKFKLFKFFLDESAWLAGFRTGGQCGRRTQNTATWKKWWEIFYVDEKQPNPVPELVSR